MGSFRFMICRSSDHELEYWTSQCRVSLHRQIWSSHTILPYRTHTGLFKIPMSIDDFNKELNNACNSGFPFWAYYIPFEVLTCYIANIFINSIRHNQLYNKCLVRRATYSDLYFRNVSFRIRHQFVPHWMWM